MTHTRRYADSEDLYYLAGTYEPTTGMIFNTDGVPVLCWTYTETHYELLKPNLDPAFLLCNSLRSQTQPVVFHSLITDLHSWWIFNSRDSLNSTAPIPWYTLNRLSWTATTTETGDTRQYYKEQVSWNLCTHRLYFHVMLCLLCSWESFRTHKHLSLLLHVNKHAHTCTDTCKYPPPCNTHSYIEEIWVFYFL